LGAGSCADIMRRVRRNGFDDEGLIGALLHGALKALVYMHGLSKIHRDVKAGNILISNQGEVKLADFGVSGTMMQGGEMRECRTFTGSPCWMAPEVMEQSDGYDAKADMWSFGITAMELAFGRAPYSTFKPMKIILLTLQEDPPTIDIYESKKKISKPLNQIITACLKKNPKERLSAPDLIKKKFLKNPKPPSYVADKLKELFSEDTNSRNLFAPEKKINISETRSLEKVDKDKPVSFRTSFVFTADKNELRDIRMGRKQTFGSKTLGDTDLEGDTGSPEEEKSNPNLEIPKPKTVTTGRFQVEDVEPEGKESVLEEKQKKPDTTPQESTSTKIGRFTVQETSPDDGEQNQNQEEKAKKVVTTKGRFLVEEITTEPAKPTEVENIPPGAIKKGRFVVEDTSPEQN